MTRTQKSLVCKRCGATFTRRSSLKRHKGEKRCPGRAMTPANPHSGRSGAARPEVLDVPPSRAQTVRPVWESAPVRAIQDGTRGGTQIVLADSRSSGLDALGRPLENPPLWFEPDARPATRRAMWIETSPDERERLFAQRSAFAVRASDDVTLLSQFHMLKALAVRLDAGIGTERDRALFEAGLRQYDATFERVRAQGNVP